MTKSELRKLRKARVAEGHSWNIETHEDSHFEIVVRERTTKEERDHERRMKRWVKRIDSDPDWR